MAGKNAEGLRGFPTPDDMPSDGGYVVFRIPKDNQYAGLILGAAQVLGYAYNWYESGDLTPDEAAEKFRVIVTQAPYEMCGCVYPNGKRILRLNEDGHVEQLTDGEWTEPTDEYAIPPTPARTELTCDERRCLAAANATNVLKTLYEEVSDAIALGADNAEALAVLIGGAIIIIGGWLGLVLAALIVPLVAAFVAFVELAAKLGDDVWGEDFTDKLQCYLFECASCDGDVVHFNFQCVREKMATYVDVFDINFFTNLQLFGQVDFILNTIGIEGLDAAGATTAIETADCSDCEEIKCRMYDFRIDQYGFAIQSLGNWTSGVGFETDWTYDSGADNSFRYIDIRNDNFITSLRKIEFGFEYTKGTVTGGGGNTAIGVFDVTFTQTFFNYTLDAIPPIPDSPLCWMDDADGEAVTTLYAQLISGIIAGGNADPGGSGTLIYIKVWYAGEAPENGVACEDPYEDCPPP